MAVSAPLECQCLGCGIYTTPEYPWSGVECGRQATAEDGLCNKCRERGGEAGKITGGELGAAVRHFSQTGDRTELDRLEKLMLESTPLNDTGL